MEIFKDYTLTWWQVGMWKVCFLCFGIAIGVYWHEIFANWLPVIIIIGLASGIYVDFALFKKDK